MASQCWINLGAGGTFAASGNLSSTPADVDRLLGNASHLILFFHGGLVNEQSGLASAERMAKNYGSAATSIGIVWETGLAETFREKLLEITRTKIFKKTLSWVLARVGIGDGPNARGAAGILDAAQIEAMLETPRGAEALDALSSSQSSASRSTANAKSVGQADLDADAMALELEYELSADPSLPDLIDEGAPGSEPIRRELDSEPGARSGLTIPGVAWFIAKVVIAVIRRHRAGTAHDVLPTAVEELLRAAYLAQVGKFAWDEMKIKAQQMWIDDGEAPGLDAHGGGVILRRLEKLQAARPDTIIDVVGHSAGSIAICEMLAAIEACQRKIRLRNVLFLAPAVRLDLFSQWVPHGPQIYQRFRMFTMTDVAEKTDQVGGPLYPRSLLYLVSGCFEDLPDTPILGMERFLKKTGVAAERDFDETRHWLQQDDRTVYSPSAAGATQGLRTTALQHGAFDDDETILASLQHLAGPLP